ncbi:MAG: endonuclease/exonuclease/phosphatase family protein [Bacteroidales bacterium]|nr:endonuclease/exonuclease/phosphatase family protein [Bacteroidales bacterium]MBQ6081351.1 endonuclease/exonuclease/phosphatase family protein [Bacteroidales bacterium]MBQ9528853.1 endonuclease/exonuclease/phosphatase family protein [Bacteroidales bacterium]
MAASLNIMFYNLENLYDTTKDATADDEEFTPMGDKRWDAIKYQTKLNNLSNVFAAVASLPGGFPAVVGVSEIENDTVLEDLLSQRRMEPANYRYVHYDSKDARGVDVALFFRPDRFKLVGSEPVKLILRSGREYIGRDILAVWGRLDGEMFCFYVCHFLSRRGGVYSSQGFRRAGAETVRAHAEKKCKEFPGLKVVVMGDMNDTPDEPSLSELLGARERIEGVAPGDYFNPMWAMYKAGLGTSIHNHNWILFDNIIVSQNLLPSAAGYPHAKGLALDKFDKHYWAHIFQRNFMMKNGKPYRSWEGNTFSGGYSDHLPILIRLK